MFIKKNIILIYIAVIILLILLPINNKGSKINHSFVFYIRLDYIIHAVLFSPWMLLKSFDKIDTNCMVWMLKGLVLAFTAEALQFFLSYRSFNTFDILANSVGIIIGLILLLVKNRLKNNERASY